MAHVGGLKVSALDSGSSSPGSDPGRDIVLCSWTRHFTLTVPLSTQVYKWVPANLIPGVTLRWTGIPSRGSLHATETGDKRRPDGPSRLVADFYLCKHTTWTIMPRLKGLRISTREQQKSLSFIKWFNYCSAF